MPKKNPEPAAEPARPDPEAADARPTMVSLTDRANRSQLRFLVREVRMRSGRYAAIKSGVAHQVLSSAAKQIAVWGKRGERTAMITSEGYRALNTVAQITVLTPPSLEIPGIGRQPNPYVTFNETTGAYKAGWVRKIGVAPGPTGNMVLTDRTTYLSLVEYLMEDLIGVSKKHPTAVCWGTRDRSPADLLEDYVKDHNADIRERAKKPRMDWLLQYLIKDDEVARAHQRMKRNLYGFYEVEPITGQGLWFDRTAEAVAGVFRSYAQTGKFGLRKLEAIAYRNVLRDHPLMPGMSLAEKDLTPIFAEDAGEDDAPIDVRAEVPVFFHEQIEQEEEIKDLLRDFESGIRTAAFTEAGPAAARLPERVTVASADAESEGTGEEGVDEKGDLRTERLEQDDLPFDEKKKPDQSASLLAEIRTAEEILGTRTVGPILERHPKVKAGRAKASLEALHAYYRDLTNEINRKNA